MILKLGEELIALVAELLYPTRRCKVEEEIATVHLRPSGVGTGEDIYIQGGGTVGLCLITDSKVVDSA